MFDCHDLISTTQSSLNHIYLVDIIGSQAVASPSLARFEGQLGLQISDLGLVPSLELALMLGALEKRNVAQKLLLPP